MKSVCLSRLSDAALVQEFATRLARNTADTAELLVYLGEIDRRKLYRPAGYGSIYKYCIGHFHLSEAAAYKRIYAARLIRQFPAVYAALAEGRVHLSGLLALMTYLNPDNAEILLAAATHKSRAQILRMLAERFPKPDVPSQIREIPAGPAASAPEPAQLAPGRVPDDLLTLSGGVTAPAETGTARVEVPAIAALPAAATSPALARVSPLSAKTYAVQFTMDEASHDLLRQAQDLLGYQVAPGDLGTVFGRALKVLVERLEREKFAATDRPQARSRKQRKDSRHVPARVKRAVRKRDAGQCTFVGASGHRCEERAGLEFDHVREYARGGAATIDGIQLRCRAHNQFQAERTFGAAFMEHKRSKAVEARGNASRALASAPAPAAVEPGEARAGT